MSYRKLAVVAPMLEALQLNEVCANHVLGWCRKPDKCPQQAHAIVRIEGTEKFYSSVFTKQTNYLSSELKQHNKVEFDNCGPGHLAAGGARHDNDHIAIQDIRILPTTDEVSIQC